MYSMPIKKAQELLKSMELKLTCTPKGTHSNIKNKVKIDLVQEMELSRSH